MIGLKDILTKIDIFSSWLYFRQSIQRLLFGGHKAQEFLGSEGKGTKTVLFYVALASPSHRPQSFFPFVPYNKFLHPPNHATTTKIPHLLHETLLKTRQSLMTYVQRVKGWWGIGEKKPQSKQNINPVGFPPILPSMFWRVDCFLVSGQDPKTSRSFPYGVGAILRLNGIK